MPEKSIKTSGLGTIVPDLDAGPLPTHSLGSTLPLRPTTTVTTTP